MTNIVGGNTGNLSQPSSSQEGSPSHPLNTSAGLDFLSLISIAYAAERNSDGKTDQEEISQLTKTNQFFDRPKELLSDDVKSYQFGEQIASHDVENFLKSLETKPTGEQSSNGVSTLKLFNHVSNSRETIGTGQSPSLDLHAEEFLKEFIIYLKAHFGLIEQTKNSSETKVSGNEITELGTQVEALDKNHSDLIYSPSQLSSPYKSSFSPELSSLSQLSDLPKASSLNDFENAGSAVYMTELSFKTLNEGIVLFEPKEDSLNGQTINFLLNADVKSKQSLNEKSAIEIKIKQKPDALVVKIFDISGDPSKIVEKTFENFNQESKILANDHKNILSIDVPIKDPGLIILNVDINAHSKSNFVPLPVSLSTNDNYKMVLESPGKNVSSNHEIVRITSKLTTKTANSLLNTNIKLNLSNPSEFLKTIDNPFLTDKEIDISTQDKSTKVNFETVDEIIKSSVNLNKSQFLTNDQLRFLAEKLQQANSSFKKQAIVSSDISKFISKMRRNFAVEAVVSKVIKSEFKTADNISLKRNFFISAADVIGYREKIGKSQSDNYLKLKDYSYLENTMYNLNKLNQNSDASLLKEQDSMPALFVQESKFNPNLFDATSSRLDQNSVKPQINPNALTTQKLNVLDAQFASRMATSFLEQAINSKENFDLILEPESFGKVRVNVSLESLQLEVKLIAENSATLSILRASEAVLQSITEMNGLKLAEYNVELNNKNQNNSGSREQKENSGGKDGNMSESRDDLDGQSGSSNDDSSHNLNLIA